MANPARIPDPRTDPLNQAPVGVDPLTTDPRFNPANTTADPRVVNRVETRSGGSGVLIAAIVLVLAVVAYLVFAPGSSTTTAPTTPATTGESTTAPAATAPATTDSAAPAPSGTMAPADTMAPAPAEPAPATTAPAPAPAN